MPTIVNRYPHFTLDGVPSSTPGWECANPLDLLIAAQRRHHPLLVPQTHGQKAKPMWRDPIEVDMRVWIFSDLDHEGAAATQYENLAYLIENWVEIPATADSTRTCVLNVSASIAYTGPVQVVDFDYSERDAGKILAVIGLWVPAGRLVTS